MTSTSRSRRVAAMLALLAAAAITALFLARFRPAAQVLGETFRPAIAAAAILIAAVAAGHLALGLTRRFALRPSGTIELPLSDSVAIGFAVFGTVAGALAWISTALLLPLTVIGAAAGAFLLVRGRHAAGVPAGGEPALSSEPAPSWRPALLLLVPPVAIALAEAIAPVNSPDELVYKLAIPHAWQLYGRMVELPLNSNSYLAMAFQSSDLAALLLGGGIAAKLAHFGLYLAALQIIRRFAGDGPCIVLAWTPALMTIAGWSWSEWGVLGLLVLSLASFERDDLATAAVALGSAAAAKYTALPWILAFGIVLLIRRTPWPLIGRLAAIAAVFGGFFYVRNALWTGSPVAPLLLPNAPHVQNYRGGAMGGWGELLTGAHIFDPAIVDESLGIVLPLCAIAGLFAWRRWRDLVLVGLLQMPVLLTIAPGSRNIINGVAPLAIAGAAFLEDVLRSSAAMLKRAAAVVLAIVLAAQLVLVLFVLNAYELTPYLAGQEDGPAYIARLRRFAPVYGWISRATPPSARLLLLGENRTFYLDRQCAAGGNLDGPRLAAWLSAFSGPDALMQEFVARGITHVVLHKPWYRVEGMPGKPLTVLEREYVLELPPRTHAVITELLNTHSVLRYRDPEYLVYELRSVTGASAAR